MKDPNRPAFSLSIVAAFAMLIAFGIPRELSHETGPSTGRHFAA
jgi:hypothetical protein